MCVFKMGVVFSCQICGCEEWSGCSSLCGYVLFVVEGFVVLDFGELLLSCVCCEDGIVCGWSIEEGGHPKCSLALSSL